MEIINIYSRAAQMAAGMLLATALPAAIPAVQEPKPVSLELAMAEAAAAMDAANAAVAAAEVKRNALVSPEASAVVLPAQPKVAQGSVVIQMQHTDHAGVTVMDQPLVVSGADSVCLTGMLGKLNQEVKEV